MLRRLILLGTILSAMLLPAAVLAPAGRAAAQPQPTLEIVPSSGPCDAPVQVRGSGFEPQDRPGRQLLFYLLRPGTADVSMGTLGSAWPDGDGAFSEWVGMRQHGCEAAALDSQAEQPSGRVVIAVAPRLSDLPTGEGERIPDIVATAEYAYTTTAPHVPTEALSIVPASGPCDGAVQVTGSGFEPGIEVVLKLASPSGEFGVGTLASAVVDSGGQIGVGFRFGELGCRTAELIAEYGDDARRRLTVGAFPAVYPTPVAPGRRDSLASVGYTFTSVTVAVAAPPEALPATGGGPGAAVGTPWWLVVTAPLAGLVLVLVMASLYLRGKRT